MALRKGRQIGVQFDPRWDRVLRDFCRRTRRSASDVIRAAVEMLFDRGPHEAERRLIGDLEALARRDAAEDDALADAAAQQAMRSGKRRRKADQVPPPAVG